MLLKVKIHCQLISDSFFIQWQWTDIYFKGYGHNYILGVCVSLISQLISVIYLEARAYHQT